MGVPVTGVIKTDDGSRVVHLSGAYPTDRRTVEGDQYYDLTGPTYYLSTIGVTYRPVILLFDVDADGLLMQAVETVESSPAKPSGMYVHPSPP